MDAPWHVPGAYLRAGIYWGCFQTAPGALSRVFTGFFLNEPDDDLAVVLAIGA